MKPYGKRIVTARMGNKVRSALKNDIKSAILDAHEEEINKYSISREWMKFIITPFWWSILIASGILGIYCLAKCFPLIVLLVKDDFVSALKGFQLFAVGLFLITVSFVSYFADKELQNEKDKQYVVSVFSNVTALVALIVALIALLKDVQL